MSISGSNTSQEMWELLNRHLSGETNGEEARRAEEYLAANPEAANEFREMERARALVRRAVTAQPVPETLHGAVLHATIDADAGSEIDFGLGTIITLPESEARSMRWLYYAAAVILLLAAGWFALRQYSGDEDRNAGGIAETVRPSGPNSAEGADSVAGILRIGMTDHLKCAVAHYKGEIAEESPEEMRTALGEEFAGLIPIVQKNIAQGRLMVAHHCTFGGRNYVHLIIKGTKEGEAEGKMVSMMITPKRKGEWLTGREGSAAAAAAIPIYRAAMEGFEVAGFETGEYFVFVASDMPEKRNLQVALDVAVPVSQALSS